MAFKDDLKKLIHKIYRKDPFINDFFSANQQIYSEVDCVITRLKNLLHFNRLDEKGCQWWENLLLINYINENIADRQAKIRAKWITTVHNNIELIQKVCDSWQRGEVLVDFIGGKIQIKFINKYGIPNALESLKSAINEVKPAHIAYVMLFKYLLIKDIHEVKTINQMGNIKLKMFSMGREDV